MSSSNTIMKTPTNQSIESPNSKDGSTTTTPTTPTPKTTVVEENPIIPKVVIKGSEGMTIEKEIKTKISGLEEEVKMYEPYIKQFWGLTLESYENMGDIALKDVLSKTSPEKPDFLIRNNSNTEYINLLSLSIPTIIRKLTSNKLRGSAFLERKTGGAKEGNLGKANNVAKKVEPFLPILGVAAAAYFPTTLAPLLPVISFSIIKETWRQTRDIKKYEIEHIFKEASTDEIDFSLLSKQFFKMKDSCYLDEKKTQFLLQKQFNEWFTTLEDDPQTKKNKVKLDMLLQYYVIRETYMGEGVYFDKINDIIQIFNESEDDLIKLIKNADGTYKKEIDKNKWEKYLVFSVETLDKLISEFIRLWVEKVPYRLNEGTLDDLDIHAMNKGYAVLESFDNTKIPEVKYHPRWPPPDPSAIVYDNYKTKINQFEPNFSTSIDKILGEYNKSFDKSIELPSIETIKENIMKNQIKAAEIIWEQNNMGNDIEIAKLFCGIKPEDMYDYFKFKDLQGEKLKLLLKQLGKYSIIDGTYIVDQGIVYDSTTYPDIKPSAGGNDYQDLGDNYKHVNQPSSIERNDNKQDIRIINADWPNDDQDCLKQVKDVLNQTITTQAILIVKYKLTPEIGFRALTGGTNLIESTDINHYKKYWCEREATRHHDVIMKYAMEWQNYINSDNFSFKNEDFEEDEGLRDKLVGDETYGADETAPAYILKLASKYDRQYLYDHIPYWSRLVNNFNDIPLPSVERNHSFKFRNKGDTCDLFGNGEWDEGNPELEDNQFYNSIISDRINDFIEEIKNVIVSKLKGDDLFKTFCEALKKDDDSLDIPQELKKENILGCIPYIMYQNSRINPLNGQYTVGTDENYSRTDSVKKLDEFPINNLLKYRIYNAVGGGGMGAMDDMTVGNLIKKIKGLILDVEVDTEDMDAYFNNLTNLVKNIFNDGGIGAAIGDNIDGRDVVKCPKKTIRGAEVGFINTNGYGLNVDKFYNFLESITDTGLFTTLKGHKDAARTAGDPYDFINSILRSDNALYRDNDRKNTTLNSIDEEYLEFVYPNPHFLKVKNIGIHNIIIKALKNLRGIGVIGPELGNDKDHWDIFIHELAKAKVDDEVGVGNPWAVLTDFTGLTLPEVAGLRDDYRELRDDRDAGNAPSTAAVTLIDSLHRFFIQKIHRVVTTIDGDDIKNAFKKSLFEGGNVEASRYKLPNGLGWQGKNPEDKSNPKSVKGDNLTKNYESIDPKIDVTLNTREKWDMYQKGMFPYSSNCRNITYKGTIDPNNESQYSIETMLDKLRRYKTPVSNKTKCNDIRKENMISTDKICYVTNQFNYPLMDQFKIIDGTNRLKDLADNNTLSYVDIYKPDIIKVSKELINSYKKQSGKVYIDPGVTKFKKFQWKTGTDIQVSGINYENVKENLNNEILKKQKEINNQKRTIIENGRKQYNIQNQIYMLDNDKKELINSVSRLDSEIESHKKQHSKIILDMKNRYNLNISKISNSDTLKRKSKDLLLILKETPKQLNDWKNSLFDGLPQAMDKINEGFELDDLIQFKGNNDNKELFGLTGIDDKFFDRNAPLNIKLDNDRVIPGFKRIDVSIKAKPKISLYDLKQLYNGLDIQPTNEPLYHRSRKDKDIIKEIEINSTNTIATNIRNITNIYEWFAGLSNVTIDDTGVKQKDNKFWYHKGVDNPGVAPAPYFKIGTTKLTKEMMDKLTIQNSEKQIKDFERLTNVTEEIYLRGGYRRVQLINPKTILRVGQNFEKGNIKNYKDKYFLNAVRNTNENKEISDYINLTLLSEEYSYIKSPVMIDNYKDQSEEDKDYDKLTIDELKVRERPYDNTLGNLPPERDYSRFKKLNTDDPLPDHSTVGAVAFNPDRINNLEELRKYIRGESSFVPYITCGKEVKIIERIHFYKNLLNKSRYLVIPEIVGKPEEETGKKDIYYMYKTPHGIEVLNNYLNFIFYYNILTQLVIKRDAYLEKINEILEGEPNFGKELLKYKSNKWLEDRGLKELIPILSSKRIRGNMSVLKSLRLLKIPSRIELYKLVIKGREKSTIVRLDSAIDELIEVKKILDEEKKLKLEKAAQIKKQKQEEKKKLVEEMKKEKQKEKKKEKKQKEKKKKKEKEKYKEVLKERKKAEEDSKKESIKEKEEIKKDEIKKIKEDKKKEKETKRKRLSLYERFFGKTDESVLKEGSYIPPDKKMLQIAEQELNEYKGIRDKLTEQIKLDKLRKSDQINFIKQEVTEKLKKIEYDERSKKDKLSAEYRNLIQLKEELEKAGKSQLKMLKEREELMDKKRKQDLDELNNLYLQYIQKIQQHSGENKNRYLLDLLNVYQGSSGSMLELKRKLQELVETPILSKGKKLTSRKKKYRDRRVKRTKKKLKQPERGVEAIKELLLLP